MKKRVRPLSHFLFLLLVCCSRAPTVTESFRDLDSDRKIIYLAYYPYLTPEQRTEILTQESESSKNLLDSWQIKPPYSFEELFKDPRHHVLRSLEITRERAEDPSAIAALHATLGYADGRTADATHDIAWKVTPPQARIKGNALYASCLSDTVVVTANFVDEQESSIRILVQKPLDHLELRVDDAYLASDRGYNFKLQLIAYCRDGSKADVSCQSEWSGNNPAGDISGCGNFSIAKRARSDPFNYTDSDSLKITAQYGGMSTTRILPVPKR